MKRIKENTLREMRRTLNDCFNSLNLLEGKRKVREMARTIKDYDTFEGEGSGLSPDQKDEAFQRFVDFLEYIGATWEAPNREKQVSGTFWDLEFTLNYAGMGGRGYTIDVMNTTDGTIQDQWVGDTYSDFLADFRELKNEYRDLYTDVDDPENLKESRRINESIFWKKKFERKIKQRVVGIFQDWVDEDNAQGMVEEFGIDPDNAVEELIDEILENEADEIHEGRYKEFLYTIIDEEDVGQDEIEEVGEAYLVKLEDLDIKTKRRIFGSSYCNKLEKQMKGVSASGDNE